jgi:redox-sensitive bicupin YhaK (pirin superfamily)
MTSNTLPKSQPQRRFGPVVSSHPHTIRSGFQAQHFSEDMFDGRMDPLLMVDHFVMTEPTFEPHLHAGISAVTFIFEDAKGDFINRDSLGNHIALKPGDLYWLAAAKGAVHDERPEAGARTHALQIFVNLPARQKVTAARSLLVRAVDMPKLVGPGYRVRLALGRSGEYEGAGGTPEEMTLLDGALEENATFVHRLQAGRAAWIYTISGDLVIDADSERSSVPRASCVTVPSADGDINLVLSTVAGAHFVLMAGRPLREPFAKHGPLVMSSFADIRRTLADYAAGRFGKIAD